MIPAEVYNAQGWIHPDEVKRFYELARDVRALGTIVNIGVEYGKSCFLFGVANPLVTIYGIDISMKPLPVRLEASNYKMIETDSGKLIKSWTQPIDLLFVDGDHSYGGVTADLGYCEHVVRGGHVIFHDCYEWDGSGKVHQICPEVNQVVSEWIACTDEFEELPWVATSRIFRRL